MAEETVDGAPCPGCGEALMTGGPYRAPGDDSSCLACGMRIVKLHDTAGFVSRVKSKKRTDTTCPRCERGVHRVLLTSSERLVEVEYCRPCQLVFVEVDEVGAAAALLR